MFKGHQKLISLAVLRRSHTCVIQSNQGRKLRFWVMLWQYTPLITESSLAVVLVLLLVLPLLSICNLKRWKLFYLHSLSGFDLLKHKTKQKQNITLTCFRLIFCSGPVFESATCSAFLLCYLKNLIILTDGC